MHFRALSIQHMCCLINEDEYCSRMYVCMYVYVIDKQGVTFGFRGVFLLCLCACDVILHVWPEFVEKMEYVCACVYIYIYIYIYNYIYTR
jgi:hypothetical protein